MKSIKRGPSWAQLGIALVAVAGLVVVSPALGGPSLRDLVKQEVSRQLDQVAGTAKKKKSRVVQGPAGPQGPGGANGANGANGAAGSARAYAEVTSYGSHNCDLINSCSFSESKGISGIFHGPTGAYCVIAPGLDANQTPAVVSVEWGTTSQPRFNATVQTFGACGSDGFDIRTERIGGAGFSNAVDDVGFHIVIP